TATTIQGLANRQGPKVFLRQVNRIWPVAFSFYENRNYREKIGEEVLTKFPSPDHFWIDYYSKKWGYDFQEVPNLAELIEKNNGVIKGVVRLGDDNPNAEAAAATIAGLQDLIIVNDEAVKHSPGLAELPVVVDLRERYAKEGTPERNLKNVEWTIQEFLPGTNSALLFSYKPAQFGYLIFDFAIMNKGFVYHLGSVDPKATDPESLKFLAKETTPAGLTHTDQDRMVNKIYEHLKPHGMVWGWDAQSENAIARRAGRNGSAVTCCTANNVSFHAAVPARDAMMPRQRRLNPDDVKVEDKYYITFISGAGDAAHTHTGLMCNGRWLYSGRGKVPFNWTVSPYVVETMPGMMEAYYEQATDNDYFVNETSGYGYTHPFAIPHEFLPGYAAKIKEASALADTHYTGLWWSGIQPESVRREWLKATGMSGFFSWSTPQKVIFTEGGPTEIQSERFFRPHYWPKEDSSLTPAAHAAGLMAQMKDVPKPWFIVIYDLDPNFAEETMKLLPEDDFKAVLMDEFFIAADKAKDKVEGRTVESVKY
ncbi:MAG: hypothetical protein WEB60_01020, partial [Terrimicrobiaceae bacterium]